MDQTRLIFWTKADPKDLKVATSRVGIVVPEVYAGDAIPEEDGALVMTMGGSLLDVLKKGMVVPKQGGIDTHRGRVYGGGTKFMVSNSPAMRHQKEDAVDQIVWDIRLANRYITRGHLKPDIGKYIWAWDFSDIIAEIEERLETEEFVYIGADTETMGLYPWYKDKQIVTVQICHKPGEATVVWTKDRPEAEIDDLKVQLRWLFNEPRIKLIGANWKYDQGWLWEKWGITCTNFVMDTTVVGSVIDENRSNSLKWHAKVYTDLGGYDDDLKNSKAFSIDAMDLVPRPLLLNYAGADPDATLRCGTYLRKELLADKRLANHYTKILHPALKAFTRIERRGVVCDMDAAQDLKGKLSKAIKEDEQTLLEMLPGEFKAKYADKIEAQKAKNKYPLTNAMLGVLLFDNDNGLGLEPKMTTEKSGQPSTSKEHLSMFEDDPDIKEFIELHVRIQATRKTESTFVDGFIKHLRPDGLWHPTYMLFAGQMFDGKTDDGGTNTGRTSAKGPAVQIIPKHTIWAKPIRKMFGCPPGMVMFQRDFNQGELRLTGAVANEENMIKAYQLDMDLHAVLGSKFANMTYEEFLKYKVASEGSPEFLLFKKCRQIAKSANFGLLYGMGWQGYLEYAWASYQVKMSPLEAQQTRETFFETYPGLPVWHTTYKNYAKKNGFVVSPLGRKRHLPLINSSDREVAAKAERQAVNSPIQGCLSDMCLWAIAEIDREMPEVWIAGMTHDSLYGYLPINGAQDKLDQMGQIMDNLPLHSDFGWDPPVRFPTDGELGFNMAELTEDHKFWKAYKEVHALAA